MKPKYVIGAVVAALLLAAFLYLYGESQVPTGQPAVRNLTAANTREFESEFNAANGDVRVLLLLSPT